ncbi:4-hydroxy-tetrahydrodipicolinate synthase [Pseudogracilibacillus auburnensis]|uniref:4-hydroxy-tetrahydrodipicolinate synthase n=1 Tax=Pseudogracilibacillus auburnensis TaxID=1494959 RepID=A0A2V3W3J5_9BACI|nr:4-hydroxy-tetrahydrodipicolinate synthase [Pseudogracilibacillus auburnensis]MBO1003132.1 4-hydroxy-tetrahydrodipicolinate synthase [Pseudogracilibacillus auburnensis]PXW88662.1 4-hydroxy-tetrahydrodipicolinate synthase [Pseudogracilibacillus auburnensis]
MHFGHVLTAMVTPFDAYDQIDLNKMTKLIEHLLNNGTEGLVITGTTGESPVLSLEETEMVYDHVVTVVNNRVPVLAGTGTNDTKKTIMLTRIAENYGVDGIMLVAPYYNRPNQAGLYEHFKQIAQATTLPIMLYNIPGRCSVHVNAETIIRLSEIDNIIAVKEACGNLDQVATIISQTRPDFYVYSGDDSLTLPMLAIGSIGIVSVASHIIGNEINEMVTAFLEGNTKKATALHLKNFPIMTGLFMAPSPAPVKAALKLKGIDVGSVRLPLVDLSEAELVKLKQIING